jgi:oligoribonuclease NrnB/cAMP/cGMP phosphodiesterase (DHH superfamily)
MAKQKQQIKTLVITHTDLDGFGCIIVLKALQVPFNDLIMADYRDYEAGNNTFPYDCLMEYQKVIYTDFSPDERCLNICKENHIDLIIIDHHKSKCELIQNFRKDTSYQFQYYYSEEKSGTLLTYDFFKNKYITFSLKEFVDLVDTYDLWKKTHPLWEKATDLNRMLYKHAKYFEEGWNKYELYAGSILNRLEADSNHFNFNRIELTKIQEARDDEDKEVKKAEKNIFTRTDEKGNKFALIRLGAKISIVCSKLLDKYKGLSYILAVNTYNEKKTGELGLSLRSRTGFSLLQLEGTAGHEEACGIEGITNERIEALWSGKEKSIPYKKDIDNS